MAPSRNADDLLTPGPAQIALVWLDRSRTLEKVCAYVEQAARRGREPVAFGEALAPYPFGSNSRMAPASIRRCRTAGRSGGGAAGGFHRLPART